MGNNASQATEVGSTPIARSTQANAVSPVREDCVFCGHSEGFGESWMIPQGIPCLPVKA